MSQVTTGATLLSADIRFPEVHELPRGERFQDRSAAIGLFWAGQWRYFFNSFRISRAAFLPDPPVSPTPGCVPLPHKYRF